MNQLATQAEPQRNGLFVAFEGMDGAGKTTLVNWVTALLELRNVPVLSTRQPWAQAARDKLEEPTLGCSDRLRVATVDREEHIRHVVEPALRRGEVVLCDRYYLTSAAYLNGSAREVLQSQAAAFRAPDLWVYVSTPLDVCAGRLWERGGVDREWSIQRLREIRAGYAYTLTILPDPMVVVPGMGAEEERANWVARIVQDMYRRRNGR